MAENTDYLYHKKVITVFIHQCISIIWLENFYVANSFNALTTVIISGGAFEKYLLPGPNLDQLIECSRFLNASRTEGD